MAKFILTGIFLFMCYSCLNAQAEYNVRAYNLAFNAAPDMQTVVDSKAEYELSNENVRVRIMPWNDSINFDDLGDATMDIAGRLGYENVNSADALELDDFQGFYTKGTRDGLDALIILLYDNSRDRSLIATISYQPGFENEAIDIALSFYTTN